jgi:hypothetical protein
MALQTSMIARQQMETTATEERCFLCGPCRDVISRTVSLESTYSQGTHPSSRQRGCYTGTMVARVHLQKKSLAVSLEGLGANTN